MMAKTEHTPGPWRAGLDVPGNMTDIKAMANVLVARVSRFTDIFRPAYQPSPQTESEANARLIAAAPDLLEALQTLTELCDERGLYPLNIEDARNAIAKATQGKLEIQ